MLHENHFYALNTHTPTYDEERELFYALKILMQSMDMQSIQNSYQKLYTPQYRIIQSPTPQAFYVDEIAFISTNYLQTQSDLIPVLAHLIAQHNNNYLYARRKDEFVEAYEKANPAGKNYLDTLLYIPYKGRTDSVMVTITPMSNIRYIYPKPCDVVIGGGYDYTNFAINHQDIFTQQFTGKKALINYMNAYYNGDEIKLRNYLSQLDNLASFSKFIQAEADKNVTRYYKQGRALLALLNRYEHTYILDHPDRINTHEPLHQRIEAITYELNR